MTFWRLDCMNWGMRALGLAHSSVKCAVIWPYTGMNETRVLQDDDVHGIEALYGVK